MRIEVHGTWGCGYCRLAESLLTRKQVPYRYVDVSGDLRARAALVQRAHGRRTVPVIFIDGQPLGGYTELAALAASGGLDRLLDSPVNDNTDDDTEADAAATSARR